MADFQKPTPTVWATPVQTVVIVEDEPHTPEQTQRHGGNEQDVKVPAWEANFCGCCDSVMPNCCMVTCCPCVSLAQISERLGVAPYRRTLVIFLVLELAEWIAALYPSESSTTSGWNSSNSTSTTYADDERETNPVLFWIIIIVRFIVFVYVWHLRQTTRRRFQIPGGPCRDCCASCCCSCCVLAQIATHTKSYKPGDCRFGPPDVLPPYTGTQHKLNTGSGGWKKWVKSDGAGAL